MIRSLCLFIVVSASSAAAVAQDGDADALTVRVDVPKGPFLVGQGVDLAVSVAAEDLRPQLELPTIKDAEIWTVSETFRPLQASSIGGASSSANAFVTQLRLASRGAGTLDLPPIVARLGERTGRSRPVRLKFDPPPVQDRPPSFLGGIGNFTVAAEADATQIRVGQEFTYRVRIKGPAAWGSNLRPDSDRLRALAIAPRVIAREDETTSEPPERAFVFLVRPTKPGSAVLPPVLVSAFDPKFQRYATKATRGVPITVVEAPAFDPTTLDEYKPPESGRAGWIGVIFLGVAGLGLATGTGVLAIRRLRGRMRTARHEARRFAMGTRDRLESLPEADQSVLARAVLEAIAEYARLGAGRPPGALTPDEARAALTGVGSSAETADAGANLVARCDRVLFGGREDEGALKRDAQGLFEALGRPGRLRRQRREPA